MTFAEEITHNGFLELPRVRFGDEWAQSFEHNGHVYAEHDGRFYWVKHIEGYWNNSLCELQECLGDPRVLDVAS